MMKNMQSKNFLLGQIILKKKVMYHRANHFGFTHSSVVACSQELDMLLNQYQEIHGSFKQLAPTY
jgi:stage 0 sporulation regulatory protein